MSDGLDDLATNDADRVAVVIRAAVGAIPGVGSVLAELVNATIPGQKSERLAHFARALSEEIRALGRRLHVLEDRLQTSEGSDLFEEAATQATRAVSADRRTWLARILAHGLNVSVLEYDRTKKLLTMLSRLADSEFILLQYHGHIADGDHANRDH